MLQELATEEDIDFMAITETHLSSDILDAEINLENYTIFRADRKERGGNVVPQTGITRKCSSAS